MAKEESDGPAPTDLDSLFRAGSDRLGNSFLIDPNRLEIPSWYDEEKFNAGQEFFRRFALSVSFSYFCALYVGFTEDSLAKAVTFTSESDTPDRSRRRYLNTMGHLYCWHISDVIKDQSSMGYRSIRFVRDWHDRIRKRLAVSENEKWTDTYISQYDTAVVQIGFVAPLILYPREFGIPWEQDEIGLANYVYFWRVIGYVLGLDDTVNACGIDLKTTRRIAKEIEQKIIVPGLQNPNENYLRLSQALMDGMKNIWPFKYWLSHGVIKGYLYPMMGVPGPIELTWKDWIVLKLFKVHSFLMYWMRCYSAWWHRTTFKMLELLIPSIPVRYR